MARAQGSPATVQRIWSKHLQPHRVDLVSTDPEFVTKVRDILYLNPPDKAIVLTWIRFRHWTGLSRSCPLRPGVTHDYEGMGRPLFAALDVAAGKIIGQSGVPPLSENGRCGHGTRLPVHLILDNYSAQSSERIIPDTTFIHANECILAEPSRTLVRRDHPETNPSRELPLPARTGTSDS
jgi:hypothetical protein